MGLTVGYHDEVVVTLNAAMEAGNAFIAAADPNEKGSVGPAHVVLRESMPALVAQAEQITGWNGEDALAVQLKAALAELQAAIDGPLAEAAALHDKGLNSARSAKAFNAAIDVANTQVGGAFDAALVADQAWMEANHFMAYQAWMDAQR